MMATLADDPRTPTALGPVQPGERIAALDILRGFALLGICVINAPGFYMPWSFKAAGETLYPSTPDRVAFWLVDFLGTGKFNSLFSFLFGVGFAIQLDRAGARGVSIVGPYLRRLAALFAFGVAHAVLIWNGDVLHIYAILGAFLLLVRKLRDRWLWALAVLLSVAPIAFGAFELYEQEPNPHTPAYYRERGEHQLRVFGAGPYDDLVSRLTSTPPAGPGPIIGEGSYADAVRERCREVYEGYVENGEAWFWTFLGSTIVVGFIVGRRRVFQDLDAYIPLFRRLAWWTGGIGLSLSAAFATFSLLSDHAARTPTLMVTLSEAFYILNRPILAAFYVSVIVLLSRSPRALPYLLPLSTVGRMALTNYLMQSVLHSAIYYGYGFGLYGRVGPAVGVVIALGVFTVQVAYSRLWMSRFRFGPMEWLWRTLTYGRPPRAEPSTPLAPA